MSVVYMFKLDDDLYKIGITGDEDRRFRQLRKASQPHCHYWARYEVEEPRTVEREVHDLLRGNRVYGEVFRLDGGLVYLTMTYLMVASGLWQGLTLFDWEELTRWIDSVRRAREA